MQNIAEFRIIGRIGKIEVKEKVTYVSVASNYNRKDGDDWKADTCWNSVTLFEKLAKRLNASKGDLVHITGRVRQNNYEAGGTTHYGVDLIADGIATLAKKDGDPADDEKHD
jgi:single-strand DNA-binding protein